MGFSLFTLELTSETILPNSKIRCFLSSLDISKLLFVNKMDSHLVNMRSFVFLCKTFIPQNGRVRAKEIIIVTLKTSFKFIRNNNNNNSNNDNNNNNNH